MLPVCLSVMLHSSALAAVLLLNENTDLGAISNPSETISVEIVASAVLEAIQQPKTEDQPAANQAAARNPGETVPKQATEELVKAEPKHEVAAAQTEIKEAAPQQADTTEHDKPKPVSEEPAPVPVVPPPETKPGGSDETQQAEDEAAKARQAAEVARREAEKQEAEREHVERRKRKEEEKREARRNDEEHKKQQKRQVREGGPTAKSTSAGSGSPSRASASAGTMLTYAARVRAQVASHKPSGAGGRGTTVVSFAVTASGGLSYAGLARSSGNDALDRLALSAVRGAAPFPAPPAGATAQQLSFSIPFHFQ